MDNQTLMIIIIAAGGGLLLLLILFIILYFTVFSKNSIKKHVREIERKYSYLDALLIGQDSQYIHRLEIISHSNLLYVDKYETFSRRFKEIYDNDDKYAEGLIRQLHTLIANNQYHNIKATINDARKAVNILEDSVNTLNDDLCALIKLEEDSRQVILGLKEEYRVVKQIYYTNANDLELVSASVNKVFAKLDSVFAQYEEHIEKAEYDEAQELIPTIKSVINALHKIFDELPNLCSLVMQVVPQKIEELNNQYLLLLKQNIPLYHLSVLQAVNDYKKEVNDIKEGIVELKVIGYSKRCEDIISEIEKLEQSLVKEVEDRKYFEETKEPLYAKVKVLDESFLKIISLLPEVKRVYLFDEEQDMRVDELKGHIDVLWSTKRSLDGFLNSATKQPYSVLREKLDTLDDNYEKSNAALKAFKAYLDSLRTSCDEAYNMISIYYYRTKQAEHTLRLISLSNVYDSYRDVIEAIYQTLCDIDICLKTEPIDVRKVNDLAEHLKEIANRFFDEVEEKYRDSSLAESAIVYANRDRNHQSDVNQQLSILEQSFFQGEFEKVYEDANSIYRRAHVEDNKGGRR